MKAQVSSGKKPLLFVFSGPSGVGKDAVLAQLKSIGKTMHFVVTTTTRPKREAEAAGVHYNFVSRDKFESMIEKKELLEWAEVYGNYYGVPRDQVDRAFKQGHDVMVKVDVQGAMTIKKVMPQSVSIFLAPPSIDELQDRLRKRNTESSADFNRRIDTAKDEMAQAKMFDYMVVNHKVEDAVAEIMNIITAEKRRTKPGKVKL